MWNARRYLIQQAQANSLGNKIMTIKNSSSILMKFSGSVALLLTIVGILLAVGGQLDFLGTERAEPAKPTTALVNNENKPKYSFYNELKQRKAELDTRRSSQKIVPTASQPTAAEENYRYVVQVGAFTYQKDADTVKRRVENLGYPARVVKGGRKLLVQAGPFIGKQNANDAEKRFRGQKMDTLIKRLK